MELAIRRPLRTGFIGHSLNSEPSYVARVHLPEYRNLSEQYKLGMFSHFEVMEAWVYIDDGNLSL